jgi:hypothetical protein
MDNGLQWGNVNESDLMKDLDVGARIILKQNFCTQYGRAWNICIPRFGMDVS